MKKVLLTGISGYIGEHCAVQLLQQGYAVKGSLRSLHKGEAVRQTIETELGEAVAERLEFCQLDLLSDDGWDEAMAGCDFCLHVASPFVTTEPKDENELIKPAVEGSLRALKAAKRAGVKRVVLTSSMVAMLGDMQGEVQVNQQSWSNVNSGNASAYIKVKP